MKLRLRLPTLLLCAPGLAQAPTPDLPDLALMRLDGSRVGLTEVLGAQGVRVLAYTGVGCPISGRYAPRLQALAERFAARGVRFVGVNASPQDLRSQVAREARELGLRFPVLKDHRQELTRALGARTTTEVFVFDGAGALRYRGAVDDQYSLGASRPAPTETWLIDALEALLAGEAPAVGRTDAPGCLLTVIEQEPLPEQVTWSGHAADVVQRRCLVCHRAGQVGPFSLETYEQARGWSAMIAAVIEEGRMPPWNAHERFDGVFANERKLSAREKALLLRWIDDGTPRGDPAEDPPAPELSADWRIGRPDAVFPMQRRVRGGPLPEEGFAVPREGVVEYQFFSAQTHYDEDRWLQALEVRPGAADVVHHVLILVYDPAADRGERRRQLDFRSYLAVAVPGDTPSVYPAGYGKRLPKGAQLIFQVHYTPNGKQRFDRSALAVRFCDQPPEYEVLTTAAVSEHLSIPPGAPAHEVRASRRLRRDTRLLGFFPHMHTRGKDFQYLAHLPDGTTVELCASRFDFNWQESYLLAEPRSLPAGTTIECVGHFDNSAANPNNPDPTATVGWGDQTWEEMFIGYFDVVQPVGD